MGSLRISDLRGYSEGRAVRQLLAACVLDSTNNLVTQSAVARNESTIAGPRAGAVPAGENRGHSAVRSARQAGLLV